MNGPYPLTIESVNANVTRTSPGAYILSRGKGPNGKWTAHYVGRSDADVADRLRQWAREGRYQQFWFEYATSGRSAYLLECQWWHQYKPADNQVHPAVPAGAGWKCPVSDCPYSR